MRAYIPVYVLFDRKGNVISRKYEEADLTNNQIEAICEYLLGGIDIERLQDFTTGIEDISNYKEQAG